MSALDSGRFSVAAGCVGICQGCVDASVSYAKEREQFDRPIGSFQAVKHILADMLVRAEVARAAVYAAAVTCDQPEVGDAGRLVAGAKLLAAEAAVANGKACVQVHGGMGFTWEVDAHLYLKRAWVLETAFGAVDEQAEAVAALL
jgi:alkylation response protein AidB-like acyl-CoA dehydrogenase